MILLPRIDTFYTLLKALFWSSNTVHLEMKTTFPLFFCNMPGRKALENLRIKTALNFTKVHHIKHNVPPEGTLCTAKLPTRSPRPSSPTPRHHLLQTLTRAVVSFYDCPRLGLPVDGRDIGGVVHEDINPLGERLQSGVEQVLNCCSIRDICFNH